MSINRHNYEEYFILFMDNELSSDDRRMVEAFIAQHPDLKEELELLQQFKLEPDTAVTYTGKEELMKIDLPVRQAGGSSPVTLSNYDEWLSLYIDNELTAEQKANVEKFLAENPVINTELSVYKRSKLQPEAIVFADKQSLYRKEARLPDGQEKVRRITPKWWRVAAAVLIVIIGTTVVLVNNKPKNSADDIAATTPGTEKTTTPVQLPEQSTSENPVAVVEEKNIVAPDNTTQNSDALKQNKNAVAVEKYLTSPKNKMRNNLVSPLKKEETAIALTNNKDNNLPKPSNNPYYPSDNNITGERVIAAVDGGTKPTNKNNDVLTNANVTTLKPQTSDPVVAALFTNEELEETDGKKNKLRGFFRKVTRTFEKRTNIEATDDDGKLLVAGLAIKLK